MAASKTIYVTKKRPMTLTCEWAECDKVYKKIDDFLTHITEHIHSFVPKVIQPVDDSTCVDDFVCEWRDCNYEMSGGFLELMRHVYFHGFHIKLKSIGLLTTLEKKLRLCTMDAGSRNVIPDLPERFHCGWKQCEFLSDNAEYFYQHVKLHGSEYPRGRDPTKCMWEGCEAVFTTKYKLIEHLRSHTQEKTVACPTCGSLFSSSTKFTDHLRRQDDLEVQSFQCSHCSKRFSSERLLRDHMRKHVNNFKCPFCEMTTPSPSTLRQHIRYRHSDERDFQCPHCSSSFKMNRDLERHIKARHEDPTEYYCEYEECDYKTRYEFQMTEHVRKKHNLKDAKYVCQVCPSRYTRGRSLTRHLMKCHSFKWPPGHRRFRYKLGEDGNFHLQTVRYESYELSQQLQNERQRKALTGISVDGVRSAQKKCTRQSKGQGLSLVNMLTPAPLAVKGQGEGHALDLTVHKGPGDTDVANIENEASTPPAHTITGSVKRKASHGAKPRKKKRLSHQHPTDSEVSAVAVSTAGQSATHTTIGQSATNSTVGQSATQSTSSLMARILLEPRVVLERCHGAETRPQQMGKATQCTDSTKEGVSECGQSGGVSEYTKGNGVSECSGVNQSGGVSKYTKAGGVSECSLNGGVSEYTAGAPESKGSDDVDEPGTLQIYTEDGELILIQTNLSGEESSPQHNVGIVSAQNTAQGVVLSIQPHEGLGRRILGTVGPRESSQGVECKREELVGLEQQGPGLKREQGVWQEKKGVGLELNAAGLQHKRVGLQPNRLGLRCSNMEEAAPEIDEEGVGLDQKGAGLVEQGVGPEPHQEAGEETGSVSHGLFYSVMNTALQDKHNELILKSSEDNVHHISDTVTDRQGGGAMFDRQEGGIMFDVQVPLGSSAVTIDLPRLASQRALIETPGGGK